MSVMEVYGLHYEADLSRQHIATLVFGTDPASAPRDGSDGPRWHTHAYEPLQVASTCYGKGHKVRMHAHPAQERRGFTGPTQEVLVIRVGRLMMYFNDAHGRDAGQYILGPGDVAVIYCGLHALEALDDVELVEVKQGPFMAGRDKVFA